MLAPVVVMKAVRVLPLVVASFRRNMGADIWHENDMEADGVARGEPGFADNGCWSWTCGAGAGAHVTKSCSRPGSHAAEPWVSALGVLPTDQTSADLYRLARLAHTPPGHLPGHQAASNAQTAAKAAQVQGI